MKKNLSRDELVEIIEDYLLTSNDKVIYLVDSFMFTWMDQSKVGGKERKIYKKYETIRASGEFKGNWDYGRGIMDVTISVYGGDGKFNTSLNIGNVDDGDWTCWKEFESLEDANFFADEVLNHWKKEVDETCGKILPSEVDLNLILCKIGLWGETN